MPLRTLRNEFLIGCSTILLMGCNQPAYKPSDTTVTSVKSPVATETPTAQAMATIPVNTTPLTMCSPLADIQMIDLEDFISNPFNPTLIADARDGGHHGVDFAYYTHPETGKAMLGEPILAMFSGRVASVSSGRMPYGNLVMIETPLERLSPGVVAFFNAYPQPTPSVPETHLTCPTAPILDKDWQFDHPSIYLLYAHMDQPAGVDMDSQVECGDPVGLVGNSGKSGNPHLHLEVRYGPGHASFASLAHYSGDATPEEMAAYCTWRVSGIFQPIDPMKLFGIGYLK